MHPLQTRLACGHSGIGPEAHQRKHWKIEFPSISWTVVRNVPAKRERLTMVFHNAHLIGNAVCVAVAWGRYHVCDLLNFVCWYRSSSCSFSERTLSRR